MQESRLAEQGDEGCLWENKPIGEEEVALRMLKKPVSKAAVSERLRRTLWGTSKD